METKAAVLAAELTAQGREVTPDLRVQPDVAARVIGVSEGTLRNWRNAETGPDYFKAGRIGDIRKRVSDLKDDRVQVEQSSISKAEAMARLDDWLDDLREKGRIGVHCLMSRQRLTPDIVHDANISEARRTVDMRGTSAALVFLFHDAVRKTLAAEVDALYADEPGAIASSTYDKRLYDLDRDLLALEMEEERLIRHAENVGVIIHRRVDADPRVLLED